MNKLHFDSQAVRNHVIPNINSAINNNGLEKAKQIANGLVIPYDFEYRSFTKNLSSEINNIKSNCNNLSSWLNQSINSIDTIQNNEIVKINNLNIKPIQARDSIVNKVY